MQTAQYKARMFLVAKYRPEYEKYYQEEKQKLIDEGKTHQRNLYAKSQDRARTRLVVGHREEYSEAYQSFRSQGYPTNSNNRKSIDQHERPFKVPLY